MLNLTTGQLEAWLIQYFWPFIRIGACFMAAPVFAAHFVPPRSFQHRPSRRFPLPASW